MQLKVPSFHITVSETAGESLAMPVQVRVTTLARVAAEPFSAIAELWVGSTLLLTYKLDSMDDLQVLGPFVYDEGEAIEERQYRAVVSDLAVMVEEAEAKRLIALGFQASELTKGSLAFFPRFVS
jgi:hypothetical protein